jgi:hypothetical protein
MYSAFVAIVSFSFLSYGLLMAWRRNVQGFQNIQELGFLTARLLRLTTYTKLARGEAQLRAAGVTVPITDIYAKYARAEAKKYTAQEGDESMLIVKDKSKV